MELSEEIRDFLHDTPFAVLCRPVDVGQGEEVVVFVKSSRDLAQGLRTSGAPVEVGWVAENTPRGPCVCLVLKVEAPSVGELAGEALFDPADEDDRRLFGLLSSQARLQIAFLDEELNLPWLTQVPWDEVRRLETEQVWDRAETWLERTKDYDFEAAKEHFQAGLGLDSLIAKAFQGRVG